MSFEWCEALGKNKMTSLAFWIDSTMQLYWLSGCLIKGIYLEVWQCVLAWSYTIHVIFGTHKEQSFCLTPTSRPLMVYGLKKSPRWCVIWRCSWTQMQRIDSREK